MTNADNQKRYDAVLILGPTAAGKTPFGEHLEKKRFRDKRCVHFDFGAHLRKVAQEGATTKALSDDDVGIIVRALKSGALLENDSFHVASKILVSFAKRRRVKEGDLLIMNGLPRHVGQASDVDAIVNIRTVICMECAPWVIGERIRRDTGGDRSDRIDDTPSEVACKLRVYEKRTIPLIDHYRRKGIEMLTVKVGLDTTPAAMAEQIM